MTRDEAVKINFIVGDIIKAANEIYPYDRSARIELIFDAISKRREELAQYLLERIENE